MQRVFRVVDTADLTPMNVKPSERMVQSVRLYGVLTPVLLREEVDDDGVIALEIVDGNRRVTAAKRVGLQKVPAVVFRNAEPEAMSAATVITNTLRSKNLLSEWQALESLGEMGRDVRQIGALTGLTPSSYHTRMRPGALPAVLREAVMSGELFPSVAEAIGRLPNDLQRELAREFEDKGWLSSADVEARRKRVRGTEEPGPAPDVPGKPVSQEGLVEQLAVLARHARSQGFGEYEWSKLMSDAWSRSAEAEDDRTLREPNPDEYDDVGDEQVPGDEEFDATWQ